ncbi:unnamed protein product, partial [Heterosigma akashiwo]
KRLWKGALEPVMLNGVAVWGKALERKTMVRQMRSVQRKAALAMTRCFKTTKAEVALALAGLTPVDLVAKELVVLQYSHGILRGRMEEVEVEIPRAYTRRQCRGRSWQLWSQEWEALEDGTGMDGGGAKVYLQFMPTLGCLRDKVWRGKAGGRRVLQLLSGHCNAGGYLASVKKQESGSCGYCGLEEEDVHHYLLRCPRWYMQR